MLTPRSLSSVLFLLAAPCLLAQSLTFTCADGSDTHCVNGSGTVALTFTEEEGRPSDYGITLSATVSGTWTLTPPSSICGTFEPPTNVLDSAGAVTTSLTASGTYYATTVSWSGTTPQGPFGAYTCAPGTYSYNLDFVNGMTTVTIAVTHIVLFRPAAPIFFNGSAVADYAISGATLNPMSTPGGWTYAYNDFPCNPLCDPFVSFTPPVNPGDTYVDELGNTIIALTPYGQVWEHQESGKSPINMDGTLLLAATLGGVYSVWDATGASGSTALYALSSVDVGGTEGSYCWSSASGEEKVLYILRSASFGGNTIIQKVVFGTPPTYTPTTLYTLPAATYGRMDPQSFGHQDCSRDNQMPINTLKDYESVVSITSTTVTRVSGSLFELRLVGQVFEDASNTNLGVTVLSVNVGAQTLVLSGSPSGTCSGTCTRKFRVPFMVGAVNLSAAGGGGYTPTVVDISGSALPIALNITTAGNGGIEISNTVDPSTGKSYAWGGNSGGPIFEKWANTWTLGDAAMPLSYGFTGPSTAFERNCQHPGSPTLAANCLGSDHNGVFSQSDGTPWFADIIDGSTVSMFRFRDGNVNPIPVPASAWNGSITNALYTSFSGGEFGKSRGTYAGVAPYWVLSTNYTTTKNSYTLSGCTVATPTVCTISSAPDITSGDPVVINGVTGCTGLNGAHTATTVSGTTVTMNVGCAGSFGGTVYITKGGAVSLAGKDVDQSFICRDLGVGVNCNRIGHSRSIPMQDGFSFYAIPRTALCNDGSCAIYSTNFGVPGNIQLMRVNFANNCLGITLNAFDCTGSHSVTPNVSGSSVTLNYVAPSSGTTIAEIGQQKRWTDGVVATNPTGACGTGGRAVLSLASTAVYTCGRTSATWSLSTPDPTYKVIQDTSGLPTHANVFSGLTPGATYYYRVTADNKWLATGSFIAGAVPSGIAGDFQVSGAVTIP